MTEQVTMEMTGVPKRLLTRTKPRGIQPSTASTKGIREFDRSSDEYRPIADSMPPAASAYISHLPPTEPPIAPKLPACQFSQPPAECSPAMAPRPGST